MSTSLINKYTRDGLSHEIKQLLTLKGYNITKILSWYYKSSLDDNCLQRIYKVVICFKSNNDLSFLDECKKSEIREICCCLLRRKGYMPNDIDKVVIFYDSEEKSEIYNEQISIKAKNLLNRNGYHVFKIIDSYDRQTNLYMAFIFFKTNDDLNVLSENDKNLIGKIYDEILKNEVNIFNEAVKTIYYFNSDENVQKNFQGNYFYAIK